MPSLHYLNPPPNPFWDFVAGLEDHPLFAAYGRAASYAPQETNNAQAETAQNNPEDAAEMSEKAQGKQPTAEDPPEVDPATLQHNDDAAETKAEGAPNMPFRGRGRFANAFNDDTDGSRRGHGCRGRGARGGAEGRGGHPYRGGFDPRYMFGDDGPWWARRGPPPPHHEGHRGHGPHHGPPPPPGFEGHRGHGPHHGPPPPPGFEGHRGHGPHHGPPPHRHHRGPHSPPRGLSEGFNLGEFLNKLGSRLGVDLSGAAEGLGLDRFTGPRNNSDSDFEPRADVFDTKTHYTAHVSLPGGKKDDVGVEWDGENSVLRVTGVVHRPGADEEMLSHLVVDGRKRETGVFEKAIRLGTKRDPASIDVAGISAKMTDGVLIIKVPKVEVEHKKREVPISSSATSSPARDTQVSNEKDSLVDADNEMYDAAPESQVANEKETEHQEDVKDKEARDDRSETMDYEHAEKEKLPEYQNEEAYNDNDWEKDGSEDEGDYVKISVD